MDTDKLIGVLGGMILSTEKHTKSDVWVKEFLIELKQTIEGQQDDLAMYKEYLDREKNRSNLLENKLKQYEDKESTDSLQTVCDYS